MTVGAFSAAAAVEVEGTIKPVVASNTREREREREREGGRKRKWREGTHDIEDHKPAFADTGTEM